MGWSGASGLQRYAGTAQSYSHSVWIRREMRGSDWTVTGLSCEKGRGWVCSSRFSYGMSYKSEAILFFFTSLICRAISRPKSHYKDLKIYKFNIILWRLTPRIITTKLTHITSILDSSVLGD